MHACLKGFGVKFYQVALGLEPVKGGPTPSSVVAPKVGFQ